MAQQILIIEDDGSFRSILERRLRSIFPEATYTACDNLKQARELLGKKVARYDLVVLDQHLPDGRGLDLLNEGWFQELTVLAMSSDNDPQMPGATVQAGAAYFLAKTQISEALFSPLVQGILDRNKLQHELTDLKVELTRIDTVKTLVSTLRHEINNPLGAVLGAVYLVQHSQSSTPELKEAAQVIESSSKRIKHVLDQLCKEMELASVVKAHEKVFHIPGDAPWQGNKK